MGLWASFKRIVSSKKRKGNKPQSPEAKNLTNSLQGASKFQALVETDALTKQASSALRRIHFWSKIQLELRTRRLCMVKESRLKQKKHQSQLKIKSKFHELEWRASSNQYFGQAYYDISKESWGWSWRERWIAVCPWEVHVVARPVISTRAVQKYKPGKKIKHAKPKMLAVVKPHISIVKGTTKATKGTS